MDIIYKYRADADYYQLVIERYYQQQSFLLRLQFQFGILSLGGVVIYLLLIRSDYTNSIESVFIALMIGTVIFIGGVSLTRWGIIQRFKRRADFGQEILVKISETGLVANGEHVQGTWNWDAYPRSVRFCDGILLIRAGAIRWLADASIQRGSSDQATNLVESKTVMHRR